MGSGTGEAEIRLLVSPQLMGYQLPRSYSTPSQGRHVYCVCLVLERDPPKDAKKRPLTREMLNEAFSTWVDGPITRDMIELIMDFRTSRHRSCNAMLCTSIDPLPRTPEARYAPLGDAAHAATPWQASGGGQAFEDAMILGALLGCVRSSDQLSTAFEIFDEVRRPRAQRILDSSRESDMILCGADQSIGLDVERMRAGLSTRADLVEDFDLMAYKDTAVEKLIARLKV